MQKDQSKPTIERKGTKTVVYDSNGRKFAVVNRNEKTGEVVLSFKNVNVIMKSQVANAVCDALKI